MYDAIVVGARCAGSPTAMLLARKGYKVLLVDRDSFPSDIMSTHYLHIPGAARLKLWGLYDDLLATGCPPLTSITVHFGEMALQPPRPPLPESLQVDPLCPRRTVLDKLLIDAAVKAGAEMREGFSVQELIFDGDSVTGVRGRANGATVAESARIVIGADGLHSRVARAVRPAEYNTRPTLTFAYYTYWSGIETGGAHLYFFDDMRGFLVFPTHDGKTCIAAGGQVEGFHEFRSDIEGNYFKLVGRVPELVEQLKTAEHERWTGTADQPNYFRKPYGPGWALVGDAGYHRDFLTGLGITDAFRDADLLTEAINEGLSGRRPLEEAMAGYEKRRNELAEPLYEVTLKIASGGDVTPADFMQFGLAMAATIPQIQPA